MNAISALYSSTVGKKIVMASTGAVMVGWMCVHVLGNLQVFQGAEVYNAYAHKLQSLGPILWAMRAGMLAVVVLHVSSAISLARTSMGARPVDYQSGRKTLATTPAAITMKAGGLLILAFLVFHLADLTLGLVHPSFIPGDAFHNLTSSLANPLVAGFYALASLAVGAHLFHGVSSMIQTVGGNHPRYNDSRFRVAAAIAAFVFVSNLLIVGGVALGLVGA